MHSEGIAYYGDTKNTWERFYDEFDKWARTHEYDRDTTILHQESIAD